MSEDKFRDFLDSLDRLEESQKQYETFVANRGRFTKELIETITELTHKHFTEKSAYPHLNFKDQLDKDKLGQKIKADEDFKFYGIWIFEELEEYVVEFTGFQVPVGKKLHYKKIEYPSFSEEALEAQAIELEKGCKIPLSAEQKADLRRYIKEDALIDQFRNDFKILLHKAFKKLALKYYPEISETSGPGIREIDYMLHTYMLMARKNIMNILSDLNVSVNILYED